MTAEMLRTEEDKHQWAMWMFNPLNAELNPISYMLALLGAHHFLHVSRIRVNTSAHCSGRKQFKG